MKNIPLLFGFTLLLCSSCKKESTASSTTTVDCSSVSSTFTADVLPLVQSSCSYSSSCHASGSNEGPGALTTYQQIYNSRSSVRSSVVSGSMPRNSTLTTTQKNKIICWIDNGSQNN